MNKLKNVHEVENCQKVEKYWKMPKKKKKNIEEVNESWKSRDIYIEKV